MGIKIGSFEFNDVMPAAIRDSDGNYRVDSFMFEPRDGDSLEYVSELIHAGIAYYNQMVEDNRGESLAYRIDCSFTYAGRKVENGWDHYAWEVRLAFDNGFGKHEITVPYRMGLAFFGEVPTLEQVLNALNADINMLDGLSEQTFEQWCLEYGFNNDSISDRESFEKIVNLRNDVRFLFAGTDAYNQFRKEFTEEW